MLKAYGWKLSDLDSVEPNGIKVFSTFAAGGGSSLGYKRAGCEVVGANDIDPEMAEHYKRNLHPPYFFLGPVRKILNDEKALGIVASADILDGSPPCTAFTPAGKRDRVWGELKKYREGQAVQVLDSLFMDFLAVVEAARPKCVIAENVPGMNLGKAKGYLVEIIAKFREIGYAAQIFDVNSAYCGVPQARRRLFFCATKEASKPRLKMNGFDKKPISVKQATLGLRLTEEEIAEAAAAPSQRSLWHNSKPGGLLSVARKERDPTTKSMYTHIKLHGERPCSTITSGPYLLHWDEPRALTKTEMLLLGGFPMDYKCETRRGVNYIVGMSVPPAMCEAVAKSVIDQWL